MCVEGLKKITTSIRIAFVPVEIRTEHLQDTNLDRYPCASFFGGAVLEYFLSVLQNGGPVLRN
jgi:hypothetical protein